MIDTIELKKHESGGACFNYVERGDGPAMHLAHANGFASPVYSKIIGSLSEHYKVRSLNFCCQANCIFDCTHGKRPRVGSWHRLAAELISFLETMNTGPVVGVGHSFGGVVTMFASIRRPDLFTKLILLDPVFLEPKIVRIARFARLTRQQHRSPLAVRARKRRNGWTSREEAFEFFRNKPLFSGWDEDMFRSYVEAGLYETGSGVELFCSPEMEAQIFESFPPDLWKWIGRVKHPCLLARGEKSDVITDASWNHFARLRPDIKRAQFDGLGHLFPMQAPDRTVELILDFAR